MKNTNRVELDGLSELFSYVDGVVENIRKETLEQLETCHSPAQQQIVHDASQVRLLIVQQAALTLLSP